MAVMDAQNPLLGETTCGTLLQKLQEIWDEVGESDEERDKMLLQIEQDCLDVYKRKVEQAAKSRAELLSTLSDAKLELSTLVAALGDKSFLGVDTVKASGTIKEQLAAIAPALEQLWKQKEERVKEFSDVQSQIQKICGEIAGSACEQTGAPAVDESDLSLKKMNEYQAKLQELQKEKSDRLYKVLDFVGTVHDLCAVLGVDFFISDLNEDKKQRLHKLQELATKLIDLWNLMDTPEDERRLFDHVTCNISASVDEVTVPGALALDLIEQAEVEVERLDQLKSNRMKELAFKRQVELEEIFAHAHIEIDPEAAREKIMALIDSGNVEPTELLADMDNQIAKAKEEALSMVDTLVAKTRAWEENRGITFNYDGVPLLAMLDEYAILRQEREEEKRRLRDQKKFGEQQTQNNKKPASAQGQPLLDQLNGSRSTGKDGKRYSMSLAAPANFVAISKEDSASHVSGTDPVPASP
ncbi:65-kDa microtubule-associated protein 1 [Hibiscus syriacus]|uniref:65-kDa microtubule-associated protein 1 n=1 Tax=Hibiscus syriacus TaxID=106335 RepID=A0A6A3CWU1_HIBSY|nr:65-kDa microtubule-associated protein 1 [Hibiscus syriacus]